MIGERHATRSASAASPAKCLAATAWEMPGFSQPDG
jgi:hypothetical protein